MGQLVYSKSCLLLLIIISLLSLVPPANAGYPSGDRVLVVAYEYDIPKPVGVEVAKGLVAFNTDNLPQLSEMGEPVIPYIPVLVVLPPWADRMYVEVESEGLETVEINKSVAANPYPIPDIGSMPLNLKPYSGNYPYPKHSYEETGVFWWSSIRVGLLKLYPYKLIDSKTLVYPQKFILRIYVDQPKPYVKHSIQRMLAHDIIESLIHSTINPSDTMKWYPLEYKCYLDPHSVSSRDYAILVPEDWVNTVTPLVALRGAMGYNTSVFTVEYVESAYNASNLTEKIRLFAEDLRELGYSYLLLAGDTNVIPTAYFYMEDFVNGEGAYKATDQYYSLLDGDWDPDSDGRKLEALDTDGNGYPDTIEEQLPDQFPDLIVGRLPASSEEELADLVNNIIMYEVNPPNSSWVYRAGLGAAILYYENEDNDGSPLMDGARLTHAIANDSLDPAGYNYTRLYEEEGDAPSTYPHEGPLNKYTVENLVNTGNALMIFNAHGSKTAIWRKVWLDDDGDGVPERGEMRWYTFMDEAMSLNPNGMRGFYYLVSCSSGRYDWEYDSLAEYILEKSGIAVVASSRISYLAWYWEPGGYFNDEYAYLFAKAVVNESGSGEAFYNSKVWYVSEHGGLATSSWVEVKVFLEYNLLGEPVIRNPFGHLGAQPLVSYGLLREGVNIIHVEYPSGMPAENALVSLIDPFNGTVINWEYTDPSGNATINIPGNYVLRTVGLYVTLDNYAVYTVNETVFPTNDSLSPTITIYSPMKGYYNSKQIRITYNITDNTMVSSAGYTVMLGGTIIHSEETGPIYDEEILVPGDGNYTVVVYAQDIFGNKANKSTWFIVDTIPPQVTINEVFPGIVISSSKVYLSWSSCDENNVTIHVVYVDGEPILETVEHRALIQLEEGNHTVMVVGIDRAGNKGNDTVKITVDTTPPTIQLVAPANNTATNKSVVKLEWRASDSLAIEYWIYRNGILVGNTTQESMIINLIEGINNIVIEAIDAAGNTHSILVVLTRDTRPPVINVEYPHISNNSTITMEYHVFDDNGIKKIVLEIPEINQVIELRDDQGIISVAFPGQGRYTVVFTATDNTGNKIVYRDTLVIDKIPPTLVVMGVSNNTWTNKPVIIAVAEDDYTVKSISIYINNSFYKEIESKTSEATIYAPLLHLTDGKYLITVKACDEAGNTRIMKLVVIIDKTSPKIEVLHPDNGAIINTDEMTLKWSISEPVSQLTLYIDGNPIPLDPSSNTTLIDGLSDGNHTIMLKAIDHAGNTAEKHIHILIDTTPPTVSTRNISIDPRKGKVIIVLDVSEETESLEAHMIKPDGTLAPLEIVDNVIEFTGTLGDYTILITCSDKANNTNIMNITIELPLYETNTPQITSKNKTETTTETITITQTVSISQWPPTLGGNTTILLGAIIAMIILVLIVVSRRR